MKRFFTIILLTSLIFSVTSKPVNALVISFDVPVLITDIYNGITATGSWVKDTLISANTYITAYNTEKAAWKQLVTDPFQSKSTLEALKRINTQTQTLISGGLGNGSPLAVANPNQYITNTGQLSVAENLDTVSASNGTYSGSIASAVIESTRSQSDTQGELYSLSQSNIPTTIQKNLCKDDNKLSDLAFNDVMQSGGDYNNTVAVAVRKKELYESLCKGDPRKDKALEKRLLALNQQRPEVGGWDTWLLATGGDNTRSRTDQTQALINQQKISAEAKAEADRQMGKGIVSQTKCGQNNNEYRTFLGMEYCPKDKVIIVTGSAQLSASYQNNIDSQTNTLISAYGGVAETPNVGNLNSLFGSFNTVNNAFTAISNFNVDQNSGGPSSNPNTSVSNSPVYTHTLVDGSKAKNDLINPIKSQLGEHSKSLVTLSSIEERYMRDMNSYLSDLSGTNGKACYDNLASSFPTVYYPILDPMTDAFIKWSDKVKYQDIYTYKKTEFDSAYNFYKAETEKTNELLTKTSTEVILIDRTKTLISDTLSSVDASDSVERIQELFGHYQNSIDKEGLPTTMSARMKESEVISYEEDIKQIKQNQVADGNVVFAGQYAKYLNACAKLRKDEHLRRNPPTFGGD